MTQRSKNKKIKGWAITTSILVILMAVIFIVTTQIPLIYGTLKLVLGDEYSSKILLKTSSISLISRTNSSFKTAPFPLKAAKSDEI